MTESTIDSQDIIGELGKAGGGLSKTRGVFLKYVGFPVLNTLITWQRALDIFEKEGEKVIKLANSLEDKQLFERILVPTLFGLEDNSRYYSVAMVLEHLIIVGSALQERIPLLSQGKSLDMEVKIEKYKPYVEIESNIIETYTQFVQNFRKIVEAQVEDVYIDNHHEHPWFGNLKPKEWAVMGAIHQMVHRRQIEAIIAKL